MHPNNANCYTYNQMCNQISTAYAVYIWANVISKSYEGDERLNSSNMEINYKYTDQTRPLINFKVSNKQSYKQNQSINQSNPVLLKERVRIPRTRRAGGAAMLWGRLPLDGVGSCRLFFTDDPHKQKRFAGKSYRWLSARLQWLQCVSNGVNAVLY